MQAPQKIKHRSRRFKTAIYLQNKKRKQLRAMLKPTTSLSFSKMSISPAADFHIIPKSVAVAMIDRFELVKTTELAAIDLVYGKQYDRAIFETLLDLEGCTQVRIINALTESKEQTFVLLAVRDGDTPLYLTKAIVDENGATIEVDAVGDMGNNCGGGGESKTAYRKLD